MRRFVVIALLATLLGISAQAGVKELPSALDEYDGETTEVQDPAQVIEQRAEVEEAEKLHQLLTRAVKMYNIRSPAVPTLQELVSLDSEVWSCQIVYHPLSLGKTTFGPIYTGDTTFAPVNPTNPADQPNETYRISLDVTQTHEKPTWNMSFTQKDNPNRMTSWSSNETHQPSIRNRRRRSIGSHTSAVQNSPHLLWATEETSAIASSIPQLQRKIIIYKESVLQLDALMRSKDRNLIDQFFERTQQLKKKRHPDFYDFMLCERRVPVS